MPYSSVTAVVVILKGNGSLITGGGHVLLSDYGNPGMASGGMGDVLSGVIGALLAAASAASGSGSSGRVFTWGGCGYRCPRGSTWIGCHRFNSQDAVNARMTDALFTVTAPDEEAMVALGARVAAGVRAGFGSIFGG